MMSAEPVALQAGKRVVLAHACRDGIDHNLGERRACEVRRARTALPDGLDDVAGRGLWHIAHQPMTVRFENRLQRAAVKLLRCLGEVRERSGAEIARSNFSKRAVDDMLR
jgi:hypothetical protein